MVIDQILRATDRKKKIVLEDGSSFVLYNGEVRKYRLSEGEEIREEVCAEIMGEVLMKRAKLRCMNLLKTSDRTVRQLTDRLKRDGYPEGIIEKALDYVASYHYTDDLRYAENYIRCWSGRKSRRMISFELEKKGVDNEKIRTAFEKFGEEASLSGPDERSGDLCAIRRLLEKRHYDDGNADFSERQKTAAYLARKGFDMSEIRQAMRNTAKKG